MTRFSFSDFANDLAENTEDATIQIANIARKFYCQIYNDTPAWVLRGNRLVSPVARRALESACTPNIPPPPPPPPPATGQCGTDYQVFGRARYKGRDIGAYVCNADIQIYVAVQFRGYFISASPLPFRYGKDANVEITYRDVSTNAVLTKTGRVASTDRDNPSGWLEWNDECSGSLGVDEFYEFWVERVDGLPDDCPGIIGYPPEPPPPPERLRDTVTVNTVYGDTVNYDVTVNADIDGYATFPGIVNVQGIAVNIDALGIGVGIVNNTTKSGPRGLPGGGGGGGSSQNDDLTEPPPPAVEEEEEEKEPGTEEVFIDSAGSIIENGIEGLYAVKINVNSVPVNAKVSWGNGAPRIVYAGWIEFLVGGFYTSRSFIDFEKSYYHAPPDATGYAITIKLGYSASIVKTVKVVQEKQEESNGNSNQSELSGG